MLGDKKNASSLFGLPRSQEVHPKVGEVKCGEEAFRPGVGFISGLIIGGARKRG